MASWRAQLFCLYLKSTMKSKPLHLIDARILRANADKLAPKKTPQGVTLELVEGNAVKGEWHRAQDAQAGRTILYLHGGGYYYGSPKSHRGLTFQLAKLSRANLFSLDYRMAPEHPFPAAVEDAVAAYKWLLDEGCEPIRITISGDSAGGGLSLAFLISCKEQGLPMPAGAVLFSPWTDLSATGASLDYNEKTDAMFKKLYIAEGAKHYLGDADPKNPMASPLYADLADLPPILTFVSANEALYDDSVRLQEKLLAAGVNARLHTERNLPHVWPIFHPRFPETGKSIAEAADFIRQHA